MRTKYQLQFRSPGKVTLIELLWVTLLAAGAEGGLIVGKVHFGICGALLGLIFGLGIGFAACFAIQFLLKAVFPPNQQKSDAGRNIDHLTFVFLIILGCVAPMAQTAASEDERKSEAQAIFSKASEMVNIKAAGSVPFVLIAKVRLQEGKKSVEGIYAISWSAPDRFRRVLRFPNFSETDVAQGDKLYRQRSTEGLPLLIWQLNRMMDFVLHYGLDPETNVKRIQSERVNGVDETCVVLERANLNSKVCLDSATNEPLTIDAKLEDAEPFREHYELADYEPFEARRFPRKMTFRGWGSRGIEVQVEKLIRVQAFAQDEFKAPKEAQISNFCENPEMTGDVKPSTRGTIPVGFRDIEVDMYFQISPIGAVRYAEVVYSSAPLKNKEILNWFIGTHFPIQSCAGRPVGYETIVRLGTGH